MQLASYNVTDSPDIQANTIGGGWPALREQQAKVAATVPKTGLVVAIDIGDSNNIHPMNKADVGHRLCWRPGKSPTAKPSNPKAQLSSH